MMRWLRYIMLFFVVVVLQLFVFNQIHFRGYINAFPYIYLILAIPFGVSGRTVLLLSALLGISIDFFTGSMGVHMSALVLMGFVRTFLLPALAPQGDYEAGVIPSVSVNGWSWYLRYSIILTLIHNTVLFFVESFTFVNAGYTLINILFSSIFTVVLLVLLQIGIQHRVR